jgi:hypothetical protein
VLFRSVAQLSVQAYHAFNKAKELFEKDAPHVEVVAAMIKGEGNAPSEDPILLMHELTEQDASAFTDKMPVAISTATELSMQVVNAAPWDAVYNAIKTGERKRQPLVEASQAEVIKLAPDNWKTDKLAKKRIQALLDMAARVIVAKKIEKAPAIDGDPSEAVYDWQVDTPWWNWKSGIDYPNRNEIAFCHDGKTLYMAARCHYPGGGLDKERKADKYGASAWKYVSMEVHLNPDERDASKEEVKRYQVIPCLGGGLWNNIHDVVKEWKVKSTDTLFQFEIAMDLEKIGMTPEDFPALRLNMVHNSRSGGHYGKTWFPSSAGHALYHARGWLVFEK